MRRKKIDMLEGNLWSDILSYTVPIILTGILQLLFNAIDMIVVGKFSGSAAMAAVSSTSSLINLVSNLFVGLSVGSSVCIARRIGRREYLEVYKAVQTSVTIAMIAGIFLMVLGVSCSGIFLRMMGSPEDILPLSTLYLRIYFLGMPATMVYHFSTAILRARGDTKRPLFALAIAGALNALLNILFVTVFHMSVAGVGLASALSSYVSAFLVIMTLIRDEGVIHLEIRKLHIDSEALKQIVKVGIPAGLQSTVFSISNVAIQSSVNSFGSIVMAGNGAAASVGEFVYTIMNSFYQSCLTFTSQNIGAGKKDRVRKILAVCIVLVAAAGIIFGNGASLFGEKLLSIYSDDPEVIAAGMIRLAYICRPYLLCGMMDVFVGTLRGMGYSIFPMITSLLGSCAFRLIWIATYFAAHRSIDILYLSYPLSWILTLSVHFLTYLYAVRKLRQKTA